MDSLIDAFAWVQQWLFEAVVQPLAFGLGAANLLELAYEGTGWLLVGLLQVAVMLLVIGPMQRLWPVEPVIDRRAIQEFPAPVLALIEGGVWGGACEVAMGCDILVATPEATFAITPAKLGVPYNLGGLLTVMNMIPLPVAKEMLFTAQPIPVSQALNLGVVNYVRPADEIETFVRGLAESIVANSPLSISVMKEELRLLSSARSITPELFERIQGLRRIVYDSQDYQEGIAAFSEKRKPRFLGR